MCAILISALITFSIHKQRLLLNIMGGFEEDGDMLITALDDADATFQERLHWSAPLDNRVLCSYRHSYLMVLVVRQ